MKPIKLIDGILILRRTLECDMSVNALTNYYYRILADSDNETHIFCFEGLSSKQPRTELYPLYKANRVPAAENIWSFINLFKKLLRFTPAIQCSVPYREADDVIAWFCKSFSDKTSLFIDTNDYDLKQLELYPNVTSAIPTKDHMQPKLVRLYKTLVGDPSDNIKGVKGLGAKSFSGLDHQDLTDWFEEGCRLPIPSCFSPKAFEWVSANLEELKAMWTITGFFEITDQQINENLIVGKNCPEEVDKILKEFML